MDESTVADTDGWWPHVTWQDKDVLIIIHAPTIDFALTQLDRAVQDHAWSRVNWRRLVLGF